MQEGLVTVFGGTGFLGRAIVRRLATAGVPVRVAARRPGRPDAGTPAGRIESCPADIRDAGDVARAMEGATGGVNAVSLYVERAGATFRSIHVEGAGVLARLAREAGVERMVHVSGIGAEQDAPSDYARARARGENRVRDGFPEAVILRPSVIFGVGDAFLSTLDSVTRLPAVPLFDDGSTRLQPVYVDDVAEAAARSLEGPGAPGRAFELGGPDVLTYREIVELVLAHRNRRRPLLALPFTAWSVLAGAASLMPGPPLTRDQVLLMQSDNVVSGGAGTFDDLGVVPRSLGSMLDTCLPR